MKTGALAARDHAATGRIVAAAQTLADLHGLDSGLAENIQTQSGEPAVRAMKQREAVADLLEELVAVGKKTEAAAKKSTTKTTSKKSSTKSKSSKSSK